MKRTTTTLEMHERTGCAYVASVLPRREVDPALLALGDGVCRMCEGEVPEQVLLVTGRGLEDPGFVAEGCQGHAEGCQRHDQGSGVDVVPVATLGHGSREEGLVHPFFGDRGLMERVAALVGEPADGDGPLGRVYLDPRRVELLREGGDGDVYGMRIRNEEGTSSTDVCV